MKVCIFLSFFFFFKHLSLVLVLIGHSYKLLDVSTFLFCFQTNYCSFLSSWRNMRIFSLWGNILNWVSTRHWGAKKTALDLIASDCAFLICCFKASRWIWTAIYSHWAVKNENGSCGAHCKSSHINCLFNVEVGIEGKKHFWQFYDIVH